MQPIETMSVSCPWCGELFDVLIEFTISEQEFIEDCSVCCRPIVFSLAIDNNGNIQELNINCEND